MRIVIDIPDTLWNCTIRLLRLFQYVLFCASIAALGLYVVLQLEQHVYQRYYSWRFAQALHGKPDSVYEFVQSHLPERDRFVIAWNHLGKLGSIVFRPSRTQRVSTNFDWEKLWLLHRFPSLNTPDLFDHPSDSLHPPVTTDIKPLRKPERQQPIDFARKGAQTRQFANLINSFILDEALFGRLEVPRLGLSVMVFEGTNERVLRRGVGWDTDSASLGEVGNLVIAGHRDTFFRPLREIQNGDIITLLTLSGRLDYIVEWKAVVAPTYAEALAPTAKPTLTLITCFPFRYVGPAPKRFIVRALAVSPPEQTIPLMPKAISTAAPVD